MNQNAEMTTGPSGSGGSGSWYSGSGGNTNVGGQMVALLKFFLPSFNESDVWFCVLVLVLAGVFYWLRPYVNPPTPEIITPRTKKKNVEARKRALQAAQPAHLQGLPVIRRKATSENRKVRSSGYGLMVNTPPSSRGRSRESTKGRADVGGI